MKEKVVERFTYYDIFLLTGRGYVLTGETEGDARDVKPGMYLEVGEGLFKITGVEVFKPLCPVKEAGLLLAGFHKEDKDILKEGDVFNIIDLDGSVV